MSNTGLFRNFQSISSIFKLLYTGIYTTLTGCKWWSCIWVEYNWVKTIRYRIRVIPSIHHCSFFCFCFTFIHITFCSKVLFYNSFNSIECSLVCYITCCSISGLLNWVKTLLYTTHLFIDLVCYSCWIDRLLCYLTCRSCYRSIWLFLLLHYFIS